MNKPIIIIIAVLVVLGGIYAVMFSRTAKGEYNTFAQCLKDKGAVFYGAFWCPHCQNQKKMFGNAARLLPYVECSTPDGNSQLPVCTQKGIKGYPTWVFPDGTEQNGEVSFDTLAEKTGCVLPETQAN